MEPSLLTARPAQERLLPWKATILHRTKPATSSINSEAQLRRLLTQARILELPRDAYMSSTISSGSYGRLSAPLVVTIRFSAPTSKSTMRKCLTCSTKAPLQLWSLKSKAAVLKLSRPQTRPNSSRAYAFAGPKRTSLWWRICMCSNANQLTRLSSFSDLGLKIRSSQRTT